MVPSPTHAELITPLMWILLVLASILAGWVGHLVGKAAERAAGPRPGGAELKEEAELEKAA